MKTIRFFHSAMAAIALAITFSACSNSSEESISNPPASTANGHYDIVVTVGKQGGMGRDVTTIIQSRSSLSEGEVIDFQNAGTEINATYTMETILKGKYYYQVPVSANQFVKLQYSNNLMNVIQPQPFVANTYNPRNYTHAWVDNGKTLVIMASNGDGDKILWTKLNAEDMRIVGEGVLDVALTPGYLLFTTSGVLTYRQSDNKLIYFYYQKTKKRNGVNEKNFHVVTINPASMDVEHNELCPIEAETAASAYGELLQQTIFFDENDNLYIACFSENTIEEGKLLRIKKGEFNIDPSYNGFPQSDGKLLTVQYMGNGKVFTYSRHDDSTLGTTIDSYAHYYSVIDLNANTRTRMKFNGAEIPYSSGRFSQRSAFNATEGKMYFGVNTATAQPCIYIYDVATGAVSEGVKIAEGYYFEQIRFVED